MMVKFSKLRKGLMVLSKTTALLILLLGNRVLFVDYHLDRGRLHCYTVLLLVGRGRCY
jgi:hypothetical protein